MLAGYFLFGFLMGVLTRRLYRLWRGRAYKRKTALSHAELRDVCAHYDRDAARFRQ